METRYKKRFIQQIIFSELFGRQMRFIAGPRQCGKTTLAKQKKILGGIPFVQVVKDSNVMKVINPDFYIVSASRFFA